MNGLVHTLRHLTGLRRMRARPLLVIAAGIAMLGAPLPAQAQPAPPWHSEHLQEEIAKRADRELRPFYAARGYRTLWIAASGRFDPAVGILLRRIETAELDGIRERKLRTRSVRRALERAVRGDPDDLARAELELSESFVRYVQAMRAARTGEMRYESAALAPVVPAASVALSSAASQPSLADHIAGMGWMHPLYAPMRDALLDRRFSGRQRQIIWQNLDRIRALPATPAERYVLVDAATARLWMYENGKPVDSMRVIVGKPESPTPVMAGFMRFAIVNPYWNIPPDLVQDTIAPNVLEKGTGYLKSGGYQVLSDWSDDAKLVDPATVDWHTVAAGLSQVRVRQLPGSSNFMGKVKFEFPNPDGIYLHDTPNKELLLRDQRQLSNGCVRLEDAERFGRWLLQDKLPRRVKQPEMRINLPQLVPVYITYLTAMPENGRIAFYSDAYGRDAVQMARAGPP
jgi:L,D-transpeptidase YcbB